MNYNSEGETLSRIAKGLNDNKAAVGAEEYSNSSTLISFDAYKDKNTTSSTPKQKIGYNEGETRNIFSVKEEDVDMDDNKLLEKYMDKIDADQRELKSDVREREERIEKRITESEVRMENHLSHIEEMIIEQNKKFDELKERVNDKLEDDKKYRHTNNIAIVIGVVTTVIAMIGIYYATISTITDILGIVK